MIKSPSTAVHDNSVAERRLLRVLGFFCMVIAVTGNHFFPDWGRTILVSTFVFVGLAFVWRRHWARRWFWGTLISLLIVHLLFVHQIRAVLNSQGILGLFLVAAGEAIVIAAVLSVPIYLFSHKNSWHR
jgi:hypothetical protein